MVRSGQKRLGSRAPRCIACAPGFSALDRSFLVAAIVLAATAPLAAETVIPSPYWRNTITFPSDSFRAAGPAAGDPGWIKFTVFVNDPTQVYFQDSHQFPFHYDFAHALVQEYLGLSRSEFDQITLFADGQQAILGAVLMPYWYSSQPPAEVVHEYGVQFVRQDPYDPAQVVALFNLVKSKVLAGDGAQAFYFPSYEQLASAEANRAYFEAQGITISSTDRWAAGNVIYAPGWALGTLKFFTAGEITTAYRSGSLLPGDILLTDGVPAEVPIVAGIVSLVPSAPSSHVAILANTYGIPFVHLALAADQAEAQQLVGSRVALRAYAGSGVADVQLIGADELNAQLVADILALKAPPVLSISPVTPYGAYSASTDGLYPADIRYFGGKAANFGLLRRSIPANAPVAAAFSFDLWTAFMAQTMPDQRTLGQTIQDRLGGYTYPPVSMAALSADLDAVRDMIKDDTVFSPELQAAVMATLQDAQYGFDLNRNIRFRSSTNVEDSAEFTGAGLYDSFSGCLADDLDGDSVGPSICDPTETNERGVFRAIRKVYASFYNDNAFLQRLRYQIPESQVGMGLLVHHSTPDEYELANGVATYSRLSAYNRSITLVTQDGAVPVTNPPLGAIPEEVKVTLYTSIPPTLTLTNYSNLVPLGSTVLTWDSDYRSLADLVVAAGNAFAAATGKSTYLLDFEYKKVAPNGELRIKQVRELPRPSTVANITPFLLNDPVEYCTFQGEYGNVFANHRLKVRWLVQTRNTQLSVVGLTASIYAGSTFEYVHGEGIRSMTGAPATWPGSSYSFASYTTTDGWQFEGLENARRYTLTTRSVGQLVSESQSPLLTIRDLGSGALELRADYSKPVPIWLSGSSQTTTTTDIVRLQPIQPVLSTDQLVERTISNGKGVVITTRFYWPQRPSGGAIIWTAPLARWDRTTITGYTAQPIVLRGFYSQTYRPEHHNFGENFLFEPGLDPDLPAGQSAELRAKNIRLIYARLGSSGEMTIITYPFIAPGDFNHDGYVNAADTEHFVNCVTGPRVPQPDVNCHDADFDDDLDVDQADFGRFQQCYSGAAPARVTCLDP